MDEVTVNFFREENLDAPILVEGLPGIGQVGKLVAEHLLDELNSEKIAEIYSPHFPPQVIVDSDGMARMVTNDIYRFDDGERKLLFLVGDFQSNTAEGHYILTECYLDIAEKLGVKRIYTLGGYGVGHLVEKSRVLSAVNMNSLKKEVEEAGGVFVGEESGGGIIGASGLLLGMGARRGIEGICLMGETSGYVVDPLSASSVTTVLSKLIDIEVDMTSLEERAEAMEQMFERIQEAEQMKQSDELRYIG